MAGYHLADIPRGQFGEVSKIVEEALELQDAAAQGARIMALVEAADLVGAIAGWLQKHEPSYSIADLLAMSNITHRAFESGHRSPR